MTYPITPHAFSRADRAYRGDIAARIQRFLPMVRRLAWHVHGSGRSGIELDDLMQTGVLALTECATNHAGPGEDGFAAYAKLRVRGAMIDLIRRHPAHSRGAAARRRAAQQRRIVLRTELGREPSDDELAAALELTVAELVELLRGEGGTRLVSLDDTYSDSDPAFGDDRPDSLQLLETQEMRESLAEAIGALPERLQLVVQLYFVEELSLSEIAAVLDVSIPRVHQIKAAALAKIREHAAARFELL
ncbi:MAG: sigma-70 family RNA polymerase sigma factor [Novosphingobium sp.]